MKEMEQIIESKRSQQCILNNLISAFNGSLEDSEGLIAEAVDELNTLQKEYFDTDEPTVKSLVQEIYSLSVGDFVEEPTIAELQDLFFQQIDLLAHLLGIELED